MLQADIEFKPQGPWPRIQGKLPPVICTDDAKSEATEKAKEAERLENIENSTDLGGWVEIGSDKETETKSQAAAEASAIPKYTGDVVSFTVHDSQSRVIVFFVFFLLDLMLF